MYILERFCWLDVRKILKQSEENINKYWPVKKLYVNIFKRTCLGNIRFIGELFKLRMLTEGIMNDCIERLLKSSNEIDIESLCCLLITIGKEIDKANNAMKMRSYFDRLKQIVEEKAISDKEQLMILDLIELRKNGWIARKIPLFENVSLHSRNNVDSKIMTKKMISHCSSRD